jgi:endoglucanase
MFSESSTRPLPDRIDRYEIVGLLGTGSFAAVYLADDPALDAPVALKVLGDHHSAVPEIRERFVNEARTLRRLASDRIVAIFDIGEWQGQPYVVMEALAGGTLEDRLSTIEPTRGDVVRLVAELGACLHAAHSGGVVHRDIKPSNLLIRSAGAPGEVSAAGERDPTSLIGADEQLVLADFGLARALGLTTLTVAGGTDGFMAPEQRVPSTTVDERADIFAATAVVTQALRGSISDDLVSDLRTSADPVDRALARGLADRADDRYPNADTWAEALTSALGDEAARTTQPHDSTHEQSAAIDPGTDAPRRSRSATMALVGAVAAIVAVVAAISVVVMRPDGDSSTAAGSAAEANSEQSGAIAAVGDVAAFAGGWSTQGSTIVDSLGTPIALRGVTWIGFDSESFVVQGLWARTWKDLVDLIAELGFNTIRLPFSSAMLEPGTVPTNIDEQLNPDLAGLTSLEVMDLIVDYAATKGLAVVLERHALSPDGLSALWYDDTYPADRFIADWEFLAGRYSTHPNVVGADLADAPHGTVCWGCGDEAVDWKLAAERAGDAIHRVAPEWLIFIAGVEQVDGAGCTGGVVTCAAWGADLRGAMTNPVRLDTTSPNKVVYSSQEFGPSLFRQSWFDDPAFPANMPGLWDGWWGELVLQDAAPVVIDSIGASLDDEIDRVWLDALLAHVDERDAGFAYWTLNPNAEGTGLLDDDWNTVDEDKMAALRPYLSGPFE